MRHRQQTQTERVTEDKNRADNLSTANADADANADANGVDNPCIGTEGAKNNDGDGNKKTRPPKIVSSFINDIISHGYSM